MCGEPGKLWRCEAGSTVEFMGEITDWRVLAKPGRYRAVAGPSISAEFEVRSGGPEGSVLHSAMQARNDTWAAYLDFLTGKFPWPSLAPVFQAGLPLRVAGNVSARDSLLHLLNHPQNPTVVLGACTELPGGLRQRLVLMRALGEYRALRAGPEGADRDAGVASQRGAIEALSAAPGYLGAFSRLQALFFSELHDPAATFAERVQAARQDADVRAVARSFAEPAFRIGLVNEDRFGWGPGGGVPPRRPPVVGPRGPR